MAKKKQKMADDAAPDRSMYHAMKVTPLHRPADPNPEMKMKVSPLHLPKPSPEMKMKVTPKYRWVPGLKPKYPK